MSKPRGLWAKIQKQVNWSSELDNDDMDSIEGQPSRGRCEWYLAAVKCLDEHCKCTKGESANTVMMDKQEKEDLALCRIARWMGWT